MTGGVYSFNRVFLGWLEGVKEDVQNPIALVISELAKSCFKRGMGELDVKALPHGFKQLIVAEARFIYRAAFVVATSIGVEALIMEWTKNEEEGARRALVRAAIHIGSEHFSNELLYRFLSEVGCLQESALFKGGLREDLIQCRGVTPEDLFSIHQTPRERALFHPVPDLNRGCLKPVDYETVYIQLFLADHDLPMAIIHFDMGKDPRSGELSSKGLQDQILKKIAKAMDQDEGIVCFTKKEECWTKKPDTWTWKYRAILPVELVVSRELIKVVDSTKRVLRGKEIFGLQIKSIPFKPMLTGSLMRINMSADNCFLAADKNTADSYPPHPSKQIIILYPEDKQDVWCSFLFPSGERMRFRLNDLDLPGIREELEFLVFLENGVNQIGNFGLKHMCQEAARSATFRTIALFNLALKLERVKVADRMTGEVGELFKEPLMDLKTFTSLSSDRLPLLFAEMKEAVTHSMLKHQEQDAWLLFRGWKFVKSPLSMLPAELLQMIIGFRREHDANSLEKDLARSGASGGSSLADTRLHGLQ